MKKLDKVGIITIVDNNNYGNRLQNLATIKVFNKLGLSVETLILNQRKGSYKYLPRAIRMIINPMIMHYKLKTRDNLTFCRIKRFEKFNQKNNIIIKRYPFWNVQKIISKYKYFSVGSDQIWNPYLDFGYGTEFLEFADVSRRLTLSPSFGVNIIPDEKKAQYMKGLKGFKSLSVREQSGADIIRKLTGKEAQVLVDPTMLIEKNEWMKIASKPTKIDTKNPYILEYFLGGGDLTIENEIMTFTDNNKWNILNLLDKNNEELYCTDPGEFLYLIKHARLVVTDSFHATVFSIIFGVPFIVYDRKGQHIMESRITTLLEKFQLESRKAMRIIDNSVLECNFNGSDKILEFEKRKAYSFLEKLIM